MVLPVVVVTPMVVPTVVVVAVPLVVVVVPLVLAALGLFLRISPYGQAIRGAAEPNQP